LRFLTSSYMARCLAHPNCPTSPARSSSMGQYILTQKGSFARLGTMLTPCQCLQVPLHTWEATMGRQIRVCRVS
jgi:hypothetical protein